MLKNFSFILIFILLFGCTTTPEGRRQLSLVSQERVARNGTRAFQRIKNRNNLVLDKRQLSALSCIVDRLTEHDSALKGGWEIAIVQDDLPNAVALPGKKIAVNSGLLRVTVNQDQLAAVLAHEVAHIQAGHGLESTSQQVGWESLDLLTGAGGVFRAGFLYPVSKIQEEEADMIGLELMNKSGFNLSEALQFWRNMQVYRDVSSDNFFSTHDSHQMRIDKIERRIASRAWSPQADERNRTKCQSTL